MIGRSESPPAPTSPEEIAMPVLLRHVPIASALLLAALVVPCLVAGDKSQSAPVGTIEGKIAIDGKPLPAGTVGFHPAKGKPVVGPVKLDGSYTIKAIAPGTYRVTVTMEAAKPAVTDKAPAKDGAPSVPIPRAYRDPKTTPLRRSSGAFGAVLGVGSPADRGRRRRRVLLLRHAPARAAGRRDR
jgi:hypothetical protein